MFFVGFRHSEIKKRLKTNGLKAWFKKQKKRLPKGNLFANTLKKIYFTTSKYKAISTFLPTPVPVGSY